MFKRISVAETQQLAETKKLCVVDIRDLASFSLGHMPDAIHLTNENFNEFLSNSDKNTAVVVVCYHGNSSQQAAQVIAQQGFSEVYSMDGGYEAWKATI